MAQLNWGLLSTGHIAEELADGIKACSTGKLLAVGSRTQESAERFGTKHGVPRRYGSYEALLADTDVQAVYVATPHPWHAQWAIKAAEAGKHILCEKPIGMNWAEAMAMVDAARVHDVFLMEAFMYRCHPQTAKLVELVKNGAVGKVGLIVASFGYHSTAGPENRAFAMGLGGGGILDVGCYPASMVRLLAGAALGLPFAEPLRVMGCGHVGLTGVDEWAAATLEFPGGILAQIATAVRLNEDNSVRVFGSEGSLYVPNPWVPSRWDRAACRIILQRHGSKAPEEVLVEAPDDLYTYEADMVARHIQQRQAPAMTWDDTLGNMRLLDQWRQQAGMVYDLEKPQNLTRTVAGRPLRARPEPQIKHGRIPGVDKPVSRLIFGCDTNNSMPETAIMLDDFFERGGTTFDTSTNYGKPNGAPEKNLGSWVRQRGVRDQVVVIEKGANFPYNTPAGLTHELIMGLERLQLDWADLYMIHRDNLEVPIGEWVDALNENLRAGRMKAFGLSNFTIARLDAFNEYAAKHGQQTFRVVSNQFSLATVLAPIWDCYLVSASDAESRAWFTRTQTPLLPWSSQARGFFTDRAGQNKQADPELVRCWYSPSNFRRKDRAEELARRKGVLPINIALAYVLCQPFPTFPLIGPKQLIETRSSLQAMDVRLSGQELRWLNLETDTL